MILSKCFRAAVAVAALGVVFGEWCAAWEPQKEARSPNEIVQTLRKRGLNVKTVPPSDGRVESLAGRYTTGPGLSGSECYLFSDASYIYTRWADIRPETIYEKGTWSVRNGFLLLNPDGSLPDTGSPSDHVYAPLLLNDAADVYLMSHRWDFSYFLDHAKEHRYPDSLRHTFKLCTLRRISQPTKSAQEQMQKELMARAWKPDSFKDQRKEPPG